jgi:hypothetical protein
MRTPRHVQTGAEAVLEGEVAPIVELEVVPEVEESPEEVTETTAQRLVRQLNEKFYGERVAIQFESGIVSPIELAKMMGVRPQQVYADIRSAKLTATQHNNTQKWTIERSVAIEYAASYLDRKAARLLQAEQEARAIAEVAS